MFCTAIVNTLPFFIALCDSGGSILLWNSTAAGITGLDAATVRSRSFSDLGAEFSPLGDALNNLPASAGTIPPLDITLRNGILMRFVLYATGLSPKAGGPVYLVSGEDVSRKKQLEEKILRTQRLEAAGSMATSFAHDFNNIISGISGALSMIDIERDDAPDKHNENYTAYLNTIRESMVKAEAMVKQLKAFSSGHSESGLTVDLCSLVKHAGDICRQSYSDSVEISVTVEPEEAPVSGDPIEFEQMVLNLCSNAYLSMTSLRSADEFPGGTMSLGLKYRTSEVDRPVWEISVADSGVGIPGEIQRQIFDPVFSGKSDVSKQGMNLAMVYSIASRHNGTVELESTPGKGTEVRILFPVPVGTGIDSATLKGREKKDPDIGGTVLICDDEDLMRRVTGQMLERQGYTVLYTAAGKEAVERYQKFTGEVSLVILDLNLYEESGLDVFRQLKKLDPDVNVIISSGYSEHEHLTEARNEGAAGFLQKPFTMDKLLKIVKKSLAGNSGSLLQEVP